MAAWFFLSLALASVEPEPTPTLTLVWHDSSALFPSAGLARLGGELEGYSGRYRT